MAPEIKGIIVEQGGLAPLELHSGIADHPALLPSLGPLSARQEVNIGNGVVLPTFAKPELFAYLAVHGASSAWFRLKWLSDFVAIIADAEEEEVAALHQRASALGAGRASAWALLLAHRFFALPLGPALRERLNRDRISRLLEAIACRELLSIREPTARPLGTAGIHLAQLLLRPGAGFALSEGIRQLRSLIWRSVQG